LKLEGTNVIKVQLCVIVIFVYMFLITS